MEPSSQCKPVLSLSGVQGVVKRPVSIRNKALPQRSDANARLCALLIQRLRKYASAVTSSLNKRYALSLFPFTMFFESSHSYVKKPPLSINRPYPVILKTVPIWINILKLHQVNFCIENITLSKFQGDIRNSFPDIAFRIYINSYEKLAICTRVGTKYCILPTLSQRVLNLKTL